MKTVDCKACDGTGNLWTGLEGDDIHECPSCEGTGKVQVRTPLKTVFREWTKVSRDSLELAAALDHVGCEPNAYERFCQVRADLFNKTFDDWTWVQFDTAMTTAQVTGGELT